MVFDVQEWKEDVQTAVLFQLAPALLQLIQETMTCVNGNIVTHPGLNRSIKMPLHVNPLANIRLLRPDRPDPVRPDPVRPDPVQEGRPIPVTRKGNDHCHPCHPCQQLH